MSSLKTNKKYSACQDFIDFIVLIGRIIYLYFCASFRCILPRSKKPLEDEIVLITGGAKGLGKAIALRFAELKATVVLWDIDKTALDETEGEIRSNNGKAYSFVCDVGSESEVNRVGELVKKQVGDVTIIVNNAGIYIGLPYLELSSNNIRKTFDINILSHYWIIRCFLPRMLEMEKGHIVGISSAGGLLGWLYMGDYGATKFAVVGMMEVLEEEIRAMGRDKEIHFTTVCPLTTNTGINKNPTCRLPSLIPLQDPKHVAEDIVTAIQRNERLLTVPRKFLYPMLASRLMPRRAYQAIADYMQMNILPNDFEEKVI